MSAVENEMAQVDGGVACRKPRQFDVEEMLAETLKSAVERSRAGLEKRQTAEEQTEEDPEWVGPSVSDLEVVPLAESEEAEEESEEELSVGPPVSHEVVLHHGTKPISAMAIDTGGARLISGGYDYAVKFWDFGGMDESFRPFRSIEPMDSYVISSLSFNSTGENILVCAGRSQAKVLDRHAHEICQTPLGDMYIVDVSKTKGHVAQLNGGDWHPKNKAEFLTCSNDGTIRLWNLSDVKKSDGFIRTKSAQGRKTFPSCCAYSPDGRLVVAGCNDGSIQMWQHGSLYVSPSIKNYGAHGAGQDITSLRFGFDANQILTRSTDDTMKLWDLRKFTTPLGIIPNLDTSFPGTDCLFSPDNKYLVTGTASRRGVKTTNGQLVFVDRTTLTVAKRIDFPATSVVKLLWPARLNQIFVGLSSGDIKILYDPLSSHRGALLCVSKPKKREKHADFVALEKIITPHALKPFKEDRELSANRLLSLSSRRDLAKSQKPELPVKGRGENGRLAPAGSTMHSFMARQLALTKQINDHQDPRDALLKYAEAEADPYWTKAFKKNQPKNILAAETEETSDSASSSELQPLFKKPRVE